MAVMGMKYRTKQLCTWLTCFCVLHIRACTAVCLDTTSLTQLSLNGKRVKANIIYISTLGSIRDCIKQCLVRTDCHVFSYQKDRLVCELGRNAQDLMKSPDFMTFDMANMNLYQDVAGACSGRPCMAGHTCVPLSLGGHHCISEDHGYTSDNRFIDNLTGASTDINAASYQECLSACQIRNCVSFFYRNGQCKEYSKRLFSGFADIVAEWRYYERTGTLGNLALRKPTSESSFWRTERQIDRSAASAVDGFRYVTPHNVRHSCLVTWWDDSPWMTIDLLEHYFIQEVMMVTKTGSYEKSILVTYGMSGTEHICGKYREYIQTQTVINIVCGTVRQGRVIKLQGKVFGAFVVCEVEVYGILL